MFSVSSVNQAFNIALAMALAALATAASMELRSTPVESVEQSKDAAASAIVEAPSDPRIGIAADWNDVPAAVALTIAADRSNAEAGEGEGLAEDSNGIIQSRAPAAPNVIAVAGAARASAAPVVAKLAALSPRTGVIFEELGNKACIGGTLCEDHCKSETGGCDVMPAYTIKLEQPAYISTLQLYAHDQVGPTRRAQLLVKVNGEPVAKPHVYRFGATLTVKVGRVGQLVTIESMHQRNGFLNGGEEAVIWDVYLFGRTPR